MGGHSAHGGGAVPEELCHRRRAPRVPSGERQPDTRPMGHASVAKSGCGYTGPTLPRAGALGTRACTRTRTRGFRSRRPLPNSASLTLPNKTQGAQQGAPLRLGWWWLLLGGGRSDNDEPVFRIHSLRIQGESKEFATRVQCCRNTDLLLAFLPSFVYTNAASPILTAALSFLGEGSLLSSLLHFSPLKLVAISQWKYV